MPEPIQTAATADRSIEDASHKFVTAAGPHLQAAAFDPASAWAQARPLFEVVLQAASVGGKFVPAIASLSAVLATLGGILDRAYPVASAGGAIDSNL